MSKTHFCNDSFLTLEGEGLKLKSECHEICLEKNWYSYLDIHTIQVKLEVQKIIHLQKSASQILNAFIDPNAKDWYDRKILLLKHFLTLH